MSAGLVSSEASLPGPGTATFSLSPPLCADLLRTLAIGVHPARPHLTLMPSLKNVSPNKSRILSYRGLGLRYMNFEGQEADT